MRVGGRKAAGRLVFEAGEAGSDDPDLSRQGGSKVGGVAQLGEHLLCKQGVVGSIPIVSTTRICLQMRRAGVHGDTRSASNDERWRRAAERAGIGLYRGMFEFGVVTRRGIRSPVCGHAVLAAVLYGRGGLCQCESGSGASLGACEQRSVFGLVNAPVVRSCV
jgi:hypothetical protein